MVAIVSGNSLGLSLTSLSTLGEKGVIGQVNARRQGDSAYVNIANGNLVLQNLDDNLVTAGLNISALRTYNSQSLVNSEGDNNDNWRIGLCRNALVTTGTANAAGSIVTRTDADGARSTYTYDGAKYINREGGGALDTILINTGGNEITWTDGGSGVLEKYNASTGALLSQADKNGNTLSFTYATSGNAAGTLINAVNTNAAGKSETVYLDYDSSNTSKKLTQVRTVLIAWTRMAISLA